MKNCCARECTTSRGTDCNPILHCFPNPEKECDRFQAWIQSIGGPLLILDSQYIYNNRKALNFQVLPTALSTIQLWLNHQNPQVPHLKGLCQVLTMNQSTIQHWLNHQQTQLGTSHMNKITKIRYEYFRDKIRRDEEANKSLKDSEQNLSSGGSYYEACGDDDNVLVVPLKTRVNGVLETVQQKVVSHESYLAVKEELKDAKEVVDVLKQKVEHLDILLKLKDERIEELQKQLERKQSRRREAESLQSNSSLPYDPLPEEEQTIIPVKFEPTKAMDISRIPRLEEWKIVLPKADLAKTASRHSTDIKKEEIEREPSVAIDSANLDDFRGVEGADLKESQDADEFKDSEETIAGAVALNIEITTENGPQITVI
ncbi:unnamed protein product, partial [Iphiclides podalirius]